MDYAADEDLIHHLTVDYLEQLSSFNHLLDGALELLQYLQPKYQLHIITNGYEQAQLKKMQASAINTFFKIMTHADVAGVKKPDPLIFDHALRLAKALPQESVMIGDNYEADILGALHVGYDAIFYNYRNDPTAPQIKQIKHLLQVKDYL